MFDNNRLPTFSILISSVLILGFFGAGVLPGVLQPVAALLCIGGMLVLSGGRRRLDWLTFFAIALVAMVLFTVVPFPPALDRVMGTTTTLQHDLVRKAANEAVRMGLVEPGEPRFCLSRNRAGTLRILLLLVAGFAAAALAARLPSPWQRRYLVFLALFGTVVAVAGYYTQRVFPQGKSLWWLFSVEHGRPIGCFINRNHFGGFVAMLCPLAGVLLLDGASRRKHLEAVLWSLCLGLMSLAVIMSLSRGAWLAYAAGGITVVGLLWLRRRFMAGICLIMVVAVVSLAVVVPARRELGERARTAIVSSQDSSFGFRLATWRDSLRILPDYPFFGTGANGLRMVLPQYRRTTRRREADFAENEYVQVPVEFGLCGLGLIVPLLVCVAVKWRRNVAAGAVVPTVGLAVGGAVAAAMAHSAVDFADRVPLYFIVLCSMIGLMTGSGEDKAGEDIPATSSSPFRRPAARIAVPGVGVLIVGMVSLYGRMPHDLDSEGRLLSAGPGELVQALEWSPTSWRAWYYLGKKTAALGTPDEVKFGERCIARAAGYDPNNYLVWRDLALVRWQMNDRDGAMEAYSRVKSLRSWVKMPELE